MLINAYNHWLFMYGQVGKGRDVGLNQIALFEAKVSSGNGEQSLSRDVYRLGQLLDFFRMLSFYVTSVGYYVCTMVIKEASRPSFTLSLASIWYDKLHFAFGFVQMTVLVVYVFLYGKAYLVKQVLIHYCKYIYNVNLSNMAIAGTVRRRRVIDKFSNHHKQSGITECIEHSILIPDWCFHCNSYDYGFHSGTRSLKCILQYFLSNICCSQSTT